MKVKIAALLGVAGIVLASPGNAETVNAFDATFTTDDAWFLSDVRDNGTADIVDLTGEGGALENDQPLPTGAAKLTTGASNTDKAEVGITRTGGYGTVGDFLTTGGSLSYSYFKDSTGDLNAFAAAAIKITVLDTNISETANLAASGPNDGFTTFIYEPTWNLGTLGNSDAVPTDQWITADISGDSGTFWHTGIYNAGNLFGDGSDAFTLQDWSDLFGGDLLDATILGISIGVGTSNQGQTAFFDDVQFTSGSINLDYDFENTAVVPVPGAALFLLTGLAGLGAARLRRRNA
ncbi:hypothetical protein EOI86_03340 [Hwanghaeella grinnelliae]|uniref:VPLPA-CTERM sorting domain-containing protein n=1 Tax=Hwanghaeella grinnelliae TaxID=2500179 RepID=A0A3S2Z978_9PROT|nr:VPLPA-CTERM sorting domain-containing protein [Hwanghaeella grinnelliae]RVU38336.1 hypothetical protein EOI86_03340 [Hwanghaeella grinnelliae]